MSAPSVVVRVKSPEAFRTISEVAVELDLPQHVLRFWESRFAQIRPVKRAGGRRYYRPDDVDLLRGIRALLYGEGYTIKGVQKLLRDHGARYVADIGQGEAMVAPAPAIEPGDAPEPMIGIKPNDPAEEAVAHLVEVHQSLAEEEREKLEMLLAELLTLKKRLRTARAATARH
jgi:DNA-binding transcriptional MerR regulator